MPKQCSTPACPGDLERIGGVWACDECGSQQIDEVMVWITKGSGATYHLEKDCRWRIKGQEFVEARGGDAAPLQRVTRSHAQIQGKAPCVSCTPEHWRH